MLNGRAERMVRTIRAAVRNMVVGQGTDWEEFLRLVLCGYCHQGLSTGASPFQLVFGVVPGMYPADPVELIARAYGTHRKLELMACSALRVQG